MVRVDFNAQLKWFTRELIAMRVSDVKGYHLPIDFDSTKITDCTAVNFNTANETPQENIVNMLTEIQGVLLTIKPKIRPEPSWTMLENGHVEITGYTTELLKIYFEKSFKESFHLFGEGQDTRGRTVLTYNGNVSDISITGNELAVFRRLLKGFGKEVSFGELAEAIRNRTNLTQGQHNRESRQATETEKEAVRSAVNVVRGKLIEATPFTEYPEIIESVRGIGYKMVI